MLVIRSDRDGGAPVELTGPLSIDAQVSSTSPNRLRYHTQRANNSLARDAERWPGEEELDPRVLGTEVVPHRKPEFAGQFRLASAGTVQPRVLQSRDGGKALGRHRERFKRQQRRSDEARCDEEPRAKRPAASRARPERETPNCEPRPCPERILM
jgi:hypothetical protein